jgi:hypothetical protein
MYRTHDQPPHFATFICCAIAAGFTQSVVVSNAATHNRKCTMETKNSSKLRLGVLEADLTAPGRTVEDALVEVDRELIVRRRCFPDWVKDGKLSMGDARDRIERLARACQLLALMHRLGDRRIAELELESEQAVMDQPKATPMPAY